MLEEEEGIMLKWGNFHQMGRGQHLCSPSVLHGWDLTRREDYFQMVQLLPNGKGH
jgi:hypothetical protein